MATKKVGSKKVASAAQKKPGKASSRKKAAGAGKKAKANVSAPRKTKAKASAPKKTATRPAAKKPSPPSSSPVAAAAPGPGVGAKAPAFSVVDQDGAPFDSSSLAGTPYVLYFYPKDDTPGCTREACGFRDELGRFEGRGVRVIGVSPDGPGSHQKFRAKYGLSFTLLSDADKTLAKAYGVWTLKKNYGREYMGIQRSTFLVGADGKIQRAWRSVKVDGHVAAVLAAAG